MLRLAKRFLRQILDGRRDEIQAGTAPVVLEPSGAVFRDELAKLDARAIVQGHCHHKSVFKLNDEREVLDGLGLDFEFLDAGCCGMAGSFGFEAGEKYEVSLKACERRRRHAHDDHQRARRAGDQPAGQRRALVISYPLSSRSRVRSWSSWSRRSRNLAAVPARAARAARSSARGRPRLVARSSND